MLFYRINSQLSGAVFSEFSRYLKKPKPKLSSLWDEKRVSLLSRKTGKREWLDRWEHLLLVVRDESNVRSSSTYKFCSRKSPLGKSGRVLVTNYGRQSFFSIVIIFLLVVLFSHYFLHFWTVLSEQILFCESNEKQALFHPWQRINNKTTNELLRFKPFRAVRQERVVLSPNKNCIFHVTFRNGTAYCNYEYRSSKANLKASVWTCGATSSYYR